MSEKMIHNFRDSDRPGGTWHVRPSIDGRSWKFVTPIHPIMTTHLMLELVILFHPIMTAHVVMTIVLSNHHRLSPAAADWS
jgi:hypothetical protein